MRYFRKRVRIAYIQVLLGVIFTSMGFGMLLVLLIPIWGFLVALILMAIGLWNLWRCL